MIAGSILFFIYFLFLFIFFKFYFLLSIASESNRSTGHLKKKITKHKYLSNATVYYVLFKSWLNIDIKKTSKDIYFSSTESWSELHQPHQIYFQRHYCISAVYPRKPTCTTYALVIKLGPEKCMPVTQVQ